MGFTPYDDSVLRKVSRPMRLSPEVVIFGVRAGQRQRLFGAYQKNVVHVSWYDPLHKIVDE